MHVHAHIRTYASTSACVWLVAQAQRKGVEVWCQGVEAASKPKRLGKNMFGVLPVMMVACRGGAYTLVLTDWD